DDPVPEPAPPPVPDDDPVPEPDDDPGPPVDADGDADGRALDAAMAEPWSGTPLAVRAAAACCLTARGATMMGSEANSTEGCNRRRWRSSQSAQADTCRSITRTALASKWVMPAAVNAPARPEHTGSPWRHRTRARMAPSSRLFRRWTSWLAAL